MIAFLRIPEAELARSSQVLRASLNRPASFSRGRNRARGILARLAGRAKETPWDPERADTRGRGILRGPINGSGIGDIRVVINGNLYRVQNGNIFYSSMKIVPWAWFSPLTAGRDTCIFVFFSFFFRFKCQILNMLNRDINQKDSKIVDNDFVKSESFSCYLLWLS